MAKRTLCVPASALLLLLCLGTYGKTTYGQSVGDHNAPLRWRSTTEAADVATVSAATYDADAETDHALGSRPTAPDGVGRTAPPQGFSPRGAVRQASATVPASTASIVNVKLPCSHGQVWRQYDISPYTLRVTSTNRPEQAVVDWILRETGYEAWHGEPLGILSASPRTLRVYHTPEMQALVAGIVERFVASRAATQSFSLRVVSLNNPNWRAKARHGLRQVSVQTPGVQAWVIQKEDASALLAELRHRSDFREHSSPHLLINNGQSTVVSTSQTHTYVRDVTLQPQVWPGFQQQTDQFDEVFALQFTPLLSSDATTIDATVKCDISQLEKLVPVMIDAPAPAAPRQRAKTEVPQTTHFHFHERFRWPTSQVLLISMGMVALPTSKDQTLVPGIPLPFGNTPARGDVLVFVESRGQLGPIDETPRTARRQGGNYSGRY